MQIDISRVSYGGIWKEFAGAELKIRPYPESRADMTIRRDGSIVLSGQSGLDIVTYSLLEWKGVEGADGKPLKLTDEVKKTIYDFGLGRNEGGETMSMFIVRVARELSRDMGADEKNFPTGQSGLSAIVDTTAGSAA